MREKLKKAGVDTGAARLATLAFEALKKAKSPAIAVEGVVEAVLGDCELLTALMKASRTQLHTAVHAYLLARAHDMKGQAGEASPKLTVSHEADDRPAEPVRASQDADASQMEIDRPVAPDMSGESQPSTVSQGINDLPVHVREHRRHGWGAKKPAAATKIRKGTALAYASTSIFARQFGSGTRHVGDVTKFDVVQVKRRGMIDAVIADGLLDLDWPDDDKTPLHQVASEAQVKAVFERAYKSFDALGISHANG